MRLLKSYSFMQDDTDFILYYMVWNKIQDLKGYFYTFAKANAEEVMHKALLHALTHFDSRKGNLTPYIKRLAREIAKDNPEYILSDFLESTVTDDVDYQIFGKQEGGPNVSKVSHDFSEDVIENIAAEESKYADICKIALCYIDKFLLLCEGLIQHNTTTKYFPEPFIKECLRINESCNNFNALCIDIYNTYGEDMEWFFHINDRIEKWTEADFAFLSSRYAKKVKLLNKQTKQPVIDADQEDYILEGKITNKKVIRVYYYDVWNYFCDMLDSNETNEIKFIIDNNYIVKTLGGSLSILNPDICDEYDIVRMEIITNVVLDTNSKIISVGSENLYLLCNNTMTIDCLERDLCGYKLKLDYEDITSEFKTSKR